MPTPTKKIARCSLWFAGLLLAACAGAPSEPEPATTEQAITRIPCAVTADCSARGGSCLGSVCRAANECAVANDCAAGTVCRPDVNFGGLCGDEEDDSSAPLPAARCSNGGVCPPGQHCDADGSCKPLHKCKTNADCPSTQMCDPATKHCVIRHPPPPPPPHCHTDADCPNGGVCDVTNGTCSTSPGCGHDPNGNC